MYKSNTKYTEQHILNQSFDDERQVLVFEQVERSGDDLTYVSSNPGRKHYDWTSGDLDYLGINTSASATDADTDWTITKFIYVSGNLEDQITKTGSWTGRVALF